jgi:Pentapeptide repeats (8 copies)
MKANLSRAKFGGACLIDANLRGAVLTNAILCHADLGGGDLSRAILTDANLSGAHLDRAILVETSVQGAILTGCRVYGVSAWDVKLSEDTKQQGLIITAKGEPEITTDDLEVAQFLYLMLHNDKLRRVIDTITSKVVLILGRFSTERKLVLDARPSLDFLASRSRRRMARFVIADISS